MKSKGLNIGVRIESHKPGGLCGIGPLPISQFCRPRPAETLNYEDGELCYEAFADDRGPVFVLLALYRHFYSHGGQKRRAWGGTKQAKRES